MDRNNQKQSQENTFLIDFEEDADYQTERTFSTFDLNHDFSNEFSNANFINFDKSSRNFSNLHTNVLNCVLPFLNNYNMQSKSNDQVESKKSLQNDEIEIASDYQANENVTEFKTVENSSLSCTNLVSLFIKKFQNVFVID